MNLKEHRQTSQGAEQVSVHLAGGHVGIYVYKISSSYTFEMIVFCYTDIIHQFKEYEKLYNRQQDVSLRFV